MTCHILIGANLCLKCSATKLNYRDEWYVNSTSRLRKASFKSFMVQMMITPETNLKKMEYGSTEKWLFGCNYGSEDAVVLMELEVVMEDVCIIEYHCLWAMGLLQLSNHVVQNCQTGEQMMYWEMLNKVNSNLVALFNKSQCDICSPVWRFCTMWLLSCKRPFISASIKDWKQREQSLRLRMQFGPR